MRKVSFYYQYSNGTSETLAVADIGDRQSITDAERTAKRRALNINQGQIIAGSTEDIIERFKIDIAPTHYRDQSKDGLAVRQSAYANLIKFFGKMAPSALKTVHGYQFLDARAKAGAPAKANKELSLMSTICHYAVRWGTIEANPFLGMMQNKTDKNSRAISRSQIVRFYLWSLHQTPTIRNVGCAAMFCYLTGFRSSEVRPFCVDGLQNDGVKVTSAKRKKGEIEVVKLREWSTRLRTVVARAKQTHSTAVMYLFANTAGGAYTRSGWGSVWADAMFLWIASFDSIVAAELTRKREWEVAYKLAYDKSKKENTPHPTNKIAKFEASIKLLEHQDYFTLQDVRPAAITTKLRNRNADAYDFAAHANPATTHKHYDRRKEKIASATE
ncbi:site-specific integrase [Undibacterium parvum]|uniref:Core-binding (CB) domain-containing protein n=1 Tax=Undibacterium parvum TaxID=401471 RepID=A0A3Q9BNE8_9BURK|nr:hypothetical protein [Undibacterium parvum]AZP10931.1 hypothetical protein EJN92_02195 [Undibacterium parvum]